EATTAPPCASAQQSYPPVLPETWDTDIVIVGAGNGGMCAAAYAAQNGLNFRIIEQNVAVQDTRHWYGAIDTSAAQAAGAEPCDRAKLLSEISRYASGKCDQRVVKKIGRAHV